MADTIDRQCPHCPTRIPVPARKQVFEDGVIAYVVDGFKSEKRYLVHLAEAHRDHRDYLNAWQLISYEDLDGDHLTKVLCPHCRSTFEVGYYGASVQKALDLIAKHRCEEMLGISREDSS